MTKRDEISPLDTVDSHTIVVLKNWLLLLNLDRVTPNMGVKCRKAIKYCGVCPISCCISETVQDADIVTLDN